MPDAKKIGDARLAQKVIEAYADGLDGLTGEECRGLGIDEAHCSTLQGALQTGPNGEVTADERAALERSGFAKEFIDGVAGADGKRALRERVKWLAENAIKTEHDIRKCCWLDQNLRTKTAPIERMIREIGSTGPDAGEVIPLLIEMLKGRSLSLVKEAAENALGQIGAPAVPRLIEALKNTDTHVRWHAAEALNKIGAAAAPAIPALIETLKDKDFGVCSVAAAAVGNIDKSTGYAVPALIETFKDTNSAAYTRQYAAYALAAIGALASPAVPALAWALVDENKDIRRVAAFALGDMGKKAFPALPFLEIMRNDPKEDPVCREVAKEAVEKIEKEIR